VPVAPPTHSGCQVAWEAIVLLVLSWVTCLKNLNRPLRNNLVRILQHPGVCPQVWMRFSKTLWVASVRGRKAVKPPEWTS